MKRIVLLFLLVISFAAIAARAADSTQVNGWISDSMCGAKHAGTGSACVKKCIEGGMTPVFVDEGKKAVWSIDNPDAVKGFFTPLGYPGPPPPPCNPDESRRREKVLWWVSLAVASQTGGRRASRRIRGRSTGILRAQRR